MDYYSFRNVGSCSFIWLRWNSFIFFLKYFSPASSSMTAKSVFGLSLKNRFPLT